MFFKRIQRFFSNCKDEVKFFYVEARINRLLKTDPNAAYPLAVANLDQAKQIGDDSLIGQSAFTLGRTSQKYRPYPKLNEAIVAYELASGKALAIKNEEAYAGVQNNLGNTYLFLPTGNRGENLKNAIACYKNVLRVYTEKDFPYEYATAQNNLGNAYVYLPTGDRGENLKKAITCFENALQIRTEKDLPYEYSTTQNNLGNAYYSLPTGDRGENLKKAITCFENALRIRTEKDFPNYYADAQSNMGNAYSDLPTGDRDENLKNAIACYQNALMIHTENNYPYEYATTQNNLGTAYADLPTGDRAENLKITIACYHNALRVYTEKDFPQYFATTQNNLGTAYADLPTRDRAENLKNAIACYNNALRVYTEKDFPQECVTTLYNMAVAYDDDVLSDWQNAYKTCAEAIKILETRIRAVSSAETRRAVAEKYASIYHRMVSLCIRLGKPDEAISFAERGKSRTLIEMLHAAQLQPSENVPEKIRRDFLKVREKLEELRLQQEMETKQTGSPLSTGESDEKSSPMHLDKKRVLSEDFRQQIDEAQKTYDSLLENIRTLDPEFAASERVQPISVDEIQAMIPEYTVFVECFTGDDGTYVFVLDRESDFRNTHLVLKDLTSSELFNHLATENWLQPYYAYLNEKTLENRQTWHNTIENTPKLLAEKFWYAADETGKSLSSLVEKIKPKRIVFIPHSGLHLLPLHLMPIQSEQRLMDKYEIAYAPSISMLRFKLKSHETEPRNENTLFAVANPDRSLTFTDSEVQAISTHFQKLHILWHNTATKAEILSESINADTVHFSCHGNFQYDNPLDSKLLLADESLTLKDIFAKLRIPNTNIVVLSACETGMVQLDRGDEYVGLASGFMYAGASSVISSLWAVDDLSTSLLMQKFYDNILNKKMGKAEALKHAQQYVRDISKKEVESLIRELAEDTKRQMSSQQERNIRESLEERRQRFLLEYGKYSDKPDNYKPFAHPYYWGAFVCNGNWN